MVNDVIDLICLINYMQFQNFERKKLIMVIYNFFIKEYILINKIKSKRRELYFSTKFLIDFSTCLLDCNRYADSELFWFALTLLTLKMKMKKNKIKSNNNKKKLRSDFTKQPLHYN